MSVSNSRIGVTALAGLLGFGLTGLADPESGVRTLPDRTFVHEKSNLSIRIPFGWEIQAPYRLRRLGTASVLGLEKESPRIAVTMIWSPMGNRPFEDVIRATADENKGDEYATLVAVYGKSQVERPTTFKIGPFLVYKVLIDDGPDPKEAGALYLFEVGKGDNRWKVRVRAVYPARGREEYMKQVEAVIANFALAQE